MVKKLEKNDGSHHHLIIYGLATLLVVFGTIIAITIYSNQWHQQQYFLDNVQRPLVELQGIIEHQERSGWSEPQLVSNQLHVIVASLEYGLQQHAYPAKSLSRSEREQLVALKIYLRSFPNHEIYSSATWDESSIQQIEQFNEALIASNLKLRTTISVNWDAFIEKINVLMSQLEKGLSNS